MLKRRATILWCKPEKGCSPQIHNTWDLVKLNKYWRVVQWVKSLGETPMTDFHTGISMCERVGQDSGCGHEESHLMHDMIYSIYDCIFCMECG